MAMKQRRKRIIRELAGRVRKKVIAAVKIDLHADFWDVTDKKGTKYRISGMEAMNAK